jgi:radical SAM superfamily enzyme YgiQ (UPF0313 family)
VPRTKTPPQMLAELDTLYNLGYRGHLDFVDDNFISNKKALKGFIPELTAWQRSHDYPFEFSTEASVNLADDAALQRLILFSDNRLRAHSAAQRGRAGRAGRVSREGIFRRRRPATFEREFANVTPLLRR